jgi:hypothetical protein
MGTVQNLHRSGDADGARLALTDATASRRPCTDTGRRPTT